MNKTALLRSAVLFLDSSKLMFESTHFAMAAAHVPQRTCLGCGLKSSQKELLRLARIDQETVVVDAERRLPGRGGYVCPKRQCGALLRRKKALHHGFRAKISAASYDAVIAYLEQHAAP